MLYRICDDTTLRFNKTHRGVENGSNPGPPLKWYDELDIPSGGCINVYLENSESKKMDPEFATDYVYHGVDGYLFPKYFSELNSWDTEWAKVGSL